MFRISRILVESITTTFGSANKQGGHIMAISKSRTVSKWVLKAGLAVMMTMLAACGNNSSNTTSAKNSPETSSKSDKQYFFTFANVSESGPIFVQLGEGVKKAAEVAGIKLKVYNNNFDGPTALRNAKLMVQDKPDLIIEYNGVEGVGKSIQEVFGKANIPSIAVNIPVPGSQWFNLNNMQLGIDTGNLVAKLAKEKGWKADNTTVLLVQSATAGYEVNNCVRYFYTTVAKEMGMKEVAPESIVPTTTKVGEHLVQVDGKANLEDSYTAVKNVLQTIPASRNILLYTVNDDSSLGAWRAIVDANRKDSTLIAGLGGSKEGVTQLRTNPQWVAEGSIFMDKWGEYLMAMGVAILNGAKPPEITASPQIVLTKENVDKYYPGGSFEAKMLPAMPTQNEYLKPTGILQKFNNIEGLK